MAAAMELPGVTYTATPYTAEVTAGRGSAAATVVGEIAAAAGIPTLSGEMRSPNSDGKRAAMPKEAHHTERAGGTPQADESDASDSIVAAKPSTEGNEEAAAVDAAAVDAAAVGVAAVDAEGEAAAAEEASKKLVWDRLGQLTKMFRESAQREGYMMNELATPGSTSAATRTPTLTLTLTLTQLQHQI